MVTVVDVLEEFPELRGLGDRGVYIAYLISDDGQNEIDDVPGAMKVIIETWRAEDPSALTRVGKYGSTYYRSGDIMLVTREDNIYLRRPFPLTDEEVAAYELTAETNDDPENVKVRDVEHGWIISRGRSEYWIFKDEEDAKNAAVAQLVDLYKQDLENASFLTDFIDEEEATQFVKDMLNDDEYVYEIAKTQPHDFVSVASQYNVETPVDFNLLADRVEEGEAEFPSDLVDAVHEARIEDTASRPLEYIKEIVSEKALPKFLEEHNLIDFEAAAKFAVDQDGWAHILGSYDGTDHTTPLGYVFVRLN